MGAVRGDLRERRRAVGRCLRLPDKDRKDTGPFLRCPVRQIPLDQKNWLPFVRYYTTMAGYQWRRLIRDATQQSSWPTSFRRLGLGGG